MSRFAVKFFSLLIIACLLTGCSFLSGPDEANITLAELPRAKTPDPDPQVSVVDIDRIESSYRKALAAAESPQLRQQILLRLADLEMTRSEQQQYAATDMGRFYDRPIAMYQELIALQAGNTEPVKGIELDQLRYKLAKAYSLDGRNEEAALVLDQLAEQNPDSAFIAETQFRRAEKAFAEGDYRNAESYYQSVVKGDNPSLQQNALYMQGWAQFKRGDYELALQSFTRVMDQLLLEARSPEQVPAVRASLGPARNNLINDTLRVMGLSLSYLDGASSIIALQKELGPRAYQHLLYEQLGQLYLEQQRFSDSAATYQHFVENNPHSDFAPDFSIRTIEVYEQGNFPSLILPAKKEFIERYGIRSSFWTQHAGAISANARNFLHQSLRELAQFDHAEAQRLKAAGERREATAAYARAAFSYREFVQTFPRDSQASAMTFLLAEALYEAEDLPQALAAYEKVAYEYRDPIHGAEAGYSAILLAQQLITAAQPSMGETLQFWQMRKINNALRFADTFPHDARAVTVLSQAAPELLYQGRFTEAIIVAERIIAWQPQPAGAVQFSAWLVSGHSRFELQQYAEAEQAYWQVLQLLPAHGQTPGAPSQEQVRERIAASIYQQAESAVAVGDKGAAIDLLLRITEVTPTTDIAIKARYDAGHYLLELERWSDAERVLLSFRKQYPQHPLSTGIPAKLVAVYQAQGKWQLAADELVLMERVSTDPDVKRQSLIMGAELYDKSGNRPLAIEHYRRYAHEYPRPLAENIEAQYRLTQLYSEIGATDQRLFWLQKLIETDRTAGNARSERSRYLAASAASELAQSPYDDFARIPLQLPLKASLQRKRAALEKALKAQEQVVSYGIAEFATKASFHIGEIYAQLSRDLMDSQRPANLDELELEQYDILLEEQAYPFEEKAIEIHEANARRSHGGLYDTWVKRSYEALAKLLPARYNKTETRLEVSLEIH